MEGSEAVQRSLRIVASGSQRCGPDTAATHTTTIREERGLLTSFLYGRYCNPPNWRRNTAIVLGGWAVCAFFVFKFSAANERRLSPPYRHIPSQNWCAWAKHDDPSLPR